MSEQLLFQFAIVNRITEVIKNALKQGGRVPDEWLGVITLVISQLLGVAVVVLVFPGTNLFAGSGASELVEQIMTGMVVGGGSNAIHFFTDLVSRRPAVIEAGELATLEIVDSADKAA